MLLLRCFFFLRLAYLSDSKADVQLPPAIFIPGLGGSLLDADVHRKNAVNPLCKLEGTESVWFNKNLFIPGLRDCWVEMMGIKLDVNATRGSAVEKDIEPDGVQVHTKGYGDIIHAFFDYGAYHGGTGIWTPVISQLKMLGYKKRDMHATPYDWRRGPGYWKHHDWPILKKYIEKVVAKASKPAILFSVSQGGPYTAAFLHHAVDANWKRKHIAGFMSYSGVFGGTPAGLGLTLWGNAKALQSTALGYDVKVDQMGAGFVKSLLRGYGGISFLMPTKQSVGDVDLIQLPPAFQSNVTSGGLHAVLAQMSSQMGELYRLVEEYPIADHPAVKTFCFYGTHLPSPASYTYLATPTKKTPGKGVASDLIDAAQTLRNGGKPDVMHLAEEMSSSLDDVLGADSQKPPAPAALPTNAKLGSDTWARVVGELLDRRRPDVLHTDPGDGLVPHASLSVCNRWRDKPGLPDVEVHSIRYGSHGSELFNAAALLSTRAAVAKIAGIPNPVDRSTPGGVLAPKEFPDGKKDMKQPLGQFRQFLPPQIAQWSCPTWVGKICRSLEIDIRSNDCSGEVMLASSKIDKGLRKALDGDMSFVRFRCPETCGSKTGSCTAGIQGGPHTTQHDMQKPLAEFEAVLPAEARYVAQWSCPTWVSHLPIPGTCDGDALLQSPGIDPGLQQALTADRNFIYKRCPDSCKGSKEADVKRGTDLADGLHDMRKPLAEFEPMLPPKAKDIAQWDCPTWVSHLAIPGTCDADALLQSPQTDPGLRKALTANPKFIYKRCPESCTSSKVADANRGASQGPGRNLTKSHKNKNLPGDGSSGLPKIASPLRKARKVARNTVSAAVGNTGGAIRYITIFAVLVAVTIAVCAVGAGLFLLRSGKRRSAEADIPLREAGDFSDFEDAPSRPMVSTWFRNLFSQQQPRVDQQRFVNPADMPLEVLPCE